jgi:hypothetical protein
VSDIINDRILVVTPTFSDDCIYDVYVDGIKYKNVGDELYSFHLDSREHTGKKIKLVVHKGSITIQDHHSVAHYPLLVGKVWSRIKITQKEYLNWAYNNKVDIKFPIVCKEGEEIEFYHIVANGPNYVEYHIDYDIIPVSNSVEANTKSVIKKIKEV